VFRVPVRLAALAQGRWVVAGECLVFSVLCLGGGLQQNSKSQIPNSKFQIKRTQSGQKARGNAEGLKGQVQGCGGVFGVSCFVFGWWFGARSFGTEPWVHFGLATRLGSRQANCRPLRRSSRCLWLTQPTGEVASFASSASCLAFYACQRVLCRFLARPRSGARV
jgi:hypothetical protein